MKRVILVADRGMVSEEVLEEIDKAGLEYIVGVRMRKAKAAREVLSRAGRYSIVGDNLHVKEVMHDGTRYVVCFNPVEAEHDRAAREAVVAALRERLSFGSSKSLIGNSGYRRYVKMEGAKLSVDEDAIKAEEKYSGKCVLRTDALLTPLATCHVLPGAPLSGPHQKPHQETGSPVGLLSSLSRALNLYPKSLLPSSFLHFSNPAFCEFLDLAEQA
ncbi:MAG: hypothetical protein ACM3ZO_12210 [Clostridia bacterium]